MKTAKEFINKFCTQSKQGTVKITLVNHEAIWDNIPSQEFLDWLNSKVSKQSIIGLIDEMKLKIDDYHDEDEKQTRWNVLTQLKQKIEEL